MDSTPDGLIELEAAAQLRVFGAVQAILPINDAFDVFATLGIFRWSQTVTFNAASGKFKVPNPMFGLGASYTFSDPGLKAQMEWTLYSNVGNDDPFFGHIDDYDLFTNNLIYQF